MEDRRKLYSNSNKTIVSSSQQHQEVCLFVVSRREYYQYQNPYFRTMSSTIDTGKQPQPQPHYALPQSLQTNALPHFVQAIANIRAEKLAYLQGLQLAPELVENESDPLAFLRYYGWDCQ